MSAVARVELGLEHGLSTPRRRALLGLAALLLVLAGLCLRLGDVPVSRSSEERCLEVSTHMVESGDWLVPRMDGEPRLKKPPLYYWAAAASAHALGGPSLLSLRLPAVLSALGLLAVVFVWGRSLGGFATGALSAATLATMLQFWTLGRRGVAEMPLALFCTLALYTFDRIYWGGRRERVPWFFAALCLAFLTKATSALLVIGLPIALRLTLDRAWPRALRTDVVGWGLACLVGCLGWYLAVLLWVPEAPQVLRESALLPLGLTRSIGSAAHVRPPWFFLEVLPGAAAPAVILAPLAAWYAWRGRGGSAAAANSRERLPLFAFGVLFVAISLIPMKQKHYLMPLLPLLALSIAPGLRAAYDERRESFDRCVSIVAWIMALLAPVLALLLGLHLVVAEENAVAAGLAVVVVLAAGALGFAAGRRGRPLVLGLSFFAIFLAVSSVHLASFGPLREVFHDRETRHFPGFDADRWEGLFERHPLLRSIYRAQDWKPRRSSARQP